MKAPSARFWILIALLLAGAGWFFFDAGGGGDEPPPPPEDVKVANDVFALLVGCSEYPMLREALPPDQYEASIRLLGPENDTTLLRSVLHRYLGVPAANIHVLAGWPDAPAKRPTRDNILGHLDRLVDEVPRGARVFFLFAGHGSQAPDEEDGDEPDGALRLRPCPVHGTVVGGVDGTPGVVCRERSTRL